MFSLAFRYRITFGLQYTSKSDNVYKNGKVVDFLNANCTNADFRDAEILESTFVAAVLNNADFRGVVLKYTDITRASIENVKYDDNLKDIFGLDK